MEVWDDPHRYLLVEGARRSSKSISILNTIVRHAVQWDGAEINILCKYLKKGENGAWKDLIRRGGIMEKWIADGMTSYVRPPGYAMSSKMPYFRLRTANGGVSEIQLNSLEYENDAENKFKDCRWSMVYVSEADSFDNRVVFDTLRQQLRSMTIPYERLKMILDCNPPEAGPDHWLYPLFFENDNPLFGRIHFDIDDNIFLSDEEKQDLYDTYKWDPVLLARYYYGQWKKATVSGVFSDVFFSNIHIVGEEFIRPPDLSPDSIDQMEILRPEDNCFMLESGWDLGDRDSAAIIGSIRHTDGDIHFDILDEVVHLRELIGLDDFVEEFITKMDWQSYLAWSGKIKNVIWRHWADTSSLRHRMNLKGTEALAVRQLSGGRINFRPAFKGPNSIAMRKNLIRRLLHENRIYVSPLCSHVIEMFRAIRSSKSMPIDPTSPLRHIFDAVSYWISTALPHELTYGIPGSEPDRKPAHAAMVAV